MRPGGRDGFISLEVSPYLANDTQATVLEARRLWAAVDRPNLMVKVPGTEAGVPAIATLIGEGININVTLLFSQSSYEAVALAYVEGLEGLAAAGGDVAKSASVASFFVSRIDIAVDAIVDQRLKSASGEERTDLEQVRGKVAIANAKLAFQRAKTLFAGPRWERLAAKGAVAQRLLWASTGTKNKAYSDVLYVEELIGRDTVNTMPPATMDAFRDHGRVVADTIEADIEGARATMATLDRLGIELERDHDAAGGRRGQAVLRCGGHPARGRGAQARERSGRGSAARLVRGDRRIGRRGPMEERQDAVGRGRAWPHGRQHRAAPAAAWSCLRRLRREAGGGASSWPARVRSGPRVWTIWWPSCRRRAQSG